MTDQAGAQRVLQMRLVVETADYDEAVAFYRDVFGAPIELAIDGDHGESVTIFDVGRATLELSNPAQVAMIDEVEVGRQVAPRLRVAFEVADSRSATDDLVSAGAELIAPPVETPWRSLNSRLAAPAGNDGPLPLRDPLPEPGCARRCPPPAAARRCAAGRRLRPRRQRGALPQRPRRQRHRALLGPPAGGVA